MKNLVSIHILCLLFLISCANNNNQIPKSLSSSYDGIWDGYAQTPGGDQYIKLEIKNGIVSGFIEFNDSVSGEDFFEDTKINGYVNSDNNLIINPSFIKRVGRWSNHGPPTYVIIETNFLSPNRIEGTYHVERYDQWPEYDWYVVKPATGKSDITISNVEEN